MRSLSRSPLRRLTALVTLAGFLASCMHWTPPQPVEPSRFSGGHRYSHVRLFLADGRELEVGNPYVAHDSLLWVDPPAGHRSLQDSHGVPLAVIRSVQVQEIDPFATGVLVTAVGVSALMVAILSTQSDPPPPPPPPPSSCNSNNCIASCPLVYSWDGHEWRLDSGTFGGAIMRALERTDVDNLDFVRSEEGTLRFKVANELHETDYLDALSVLAVDHDSGVTVAPDAAGLLHTLGALTSASHALDLAGNDVLSRVSTLDGWNWESSPAIRDTSRTTDIQDGVVLAFPRPAGATSGRLVVDANVTAWAATLMTAFVAAHGQATQAWYDSLAADPARARLFGAALARQGFLGVAVLVNGQWQKQGIVWDAGPEIVKRQVVPLDLSGVSGDMVQVRLTSVPSFWLVDHVAMDYSGERPITVTQLSAATATDVRGNDARATLGSIDGNAMALEPGDSAKVTFSPPTVPPHQARTYMLQATGWYRIHASEEGPPEVALLSRVLSGPDGLAKEAVARMNTALLALARRAQ